MVSVSEDRQQQLSPGLAIKTPCRTASTVALILSGEQTIDGVACVEGDRVLVKNQADSADNGVYVVSTGSWTRAQDFDGTRDLTDGTLVLVTDGANPLSLYRLECADSPVVVGTSALTFTLGIVTATDAGNVTFVGDGTGAISRTVQSKLLDIVSVFEWFTPAEIADVRARTKLVDVTAKINAAWEWGSDNKVAIYMPPGTFKATDTLWATPEGSVFQGCHILGAGGGFVDSIAQTVIDTAVTTKPGIVIQKARGAYIGHLCLMGAGKRIETTIAIPDLLYTAAWVTAGHRDSRYSPMCGIAIDAGNGNVPPDGGYPGFTYQATSGGSSEIILDNVTIDRFVVGLMHDPDVGTTNGDSVTIIQPLIVNSKVGIAVGQSQARGINVFGGAIGWCRTAYEGNEYGQQIGAAPTFYGTQFGPGFQIFSHNAGVGALTFHSGRCESLHSIGRANAGAGGSPVIFDNMDLHLLAPAFGKRCPVVVEAPNCPVYFNGGALMDDGPPYSEAILVLGNPTVFQSSQLRVANRFRPYIGGYIDFNKPARLSHCIIFDGTANVIYGDDARYFAISGRISEHWSPSFRRTRNARYDFVPGHDDNYENIGVMSNVAFAATTLTFDNTDAAGGIMVGDLIWWGMNPVGGSVSGWIAIAAKVTNVAAPTVTCDLLFDRAYYDETAIPANTRVAVHEWAPGQSLTGDTHTNTTLDNVSPTSILQNGDWLRGAGVIPANTRVTAGGGTATITLSRATTGTIAGIRIGSGFLKDNTTEGNVSADNGNAAKSIEYGLNEHTQVWNTPITADRAVTLSTMLALDGAEFHIIRTAAATGAFNLNVGAGPLKALAAGQQCRVKFNVNTGAWMLTEFAAL